MTTLAHEAVTRLHFGLAGLGFAPTSEENGANNIAFRLGDLAVSDDGGWITVMRTAAAEGGSPLGAPGLWKALPPAVGGGSVGAVDVFDVPLGAIGGDDAEAAGWADGEGDAPSPAALAVKWAVQTAGGQVPEGWSPPPRAEIESWLAPGALSIQVHEIARQGRLIVEPNRLAIVFPVLPPLAAPLLAARPACLRDLLADAQRTWRLVRVGIVSHTNNNAGESVEAEVDLTGAPAAILEPLCRFAVGALHHVVRWVTPSVVAVAESASALLDAYERP